MIACTFPAANVAVTSGRFKTVRQGRAQQQVIEAQSGIALPAVTHVVPERIDALAGMQRAQGVGPALLDQARILGAALRLHQRVVIPRFGRINVDFGPGDIVVAGETHRRFRAQQRTRMGLQALEPRELVVEFRAWLRIAVRQIDAGNDDAVHRGFDVARFRIGLVAGQRGSGHDRLRAARKDCDAVPGLLAAPHRAIARACDRAFGKLRVGGFQFLQTDNVRPRGLEPLQQVRQPAVDVVDVEGRDLHGNRISRPDKTRTCSPLTKVSG